MSKKEEALRAKFVGLADAVKAQLVQRDEIVEGMVCAALAGEHVLLLGPPGTAKSALARTFAKGVSGANYFEWLLTRFSAPEELFGPISLEGLKKDQYRRVTAGKLPEADVAFLDEIFKGNSAILNTLLTAINERVFHNGGAPKTIPLRMVVGASNEIPEESELAALYDRFLVRYWIDYLEGPDDFTNMLVAGDPESQAPSVSLQEWDDAVALVSKVAVDKDTARALFRLRKKLAGDGVLASDRRWKRMVRLAKANAWMSGDTAVMEDHFGILADALWSDPGQRDVVGPAVAQAQSSTVGDAKRIFDAVCKLIDDLPAAPSDPHDKPYQEKIISVTRELARAESALSGHVGKARSEGQRNKLTAMQEQLQRKAAPLRQAARESLGLG